MGNTEHTENGTFQGQLGDQHSRKHESIVGSFSLCSRHKLPPASSIAMLWRTWIRWYSWRRASGTQAGCDGVTAGCVHCSSGSSRRDFLFSDERELSGCAWCCSAWWRGWAFCCLELNGRCAGRRRGLALCSDSEAKLIDVNKLFTEALILHFKTCLL